MSWWRTGIPGCGEDAGNGIAGEVKDLAGKYVMPGLIDAHVHIANDPKESQADRAKHLEYFLRHGITSIRDAAGDARVLKDLKAGVEQGKYPGPDIYYAAFMAGPAYFEGNDGRKAWWKDGQSRLPRGCNAFVPVTIWIKPCGKRKSGDARE